MTSNCCHYKAWHKSIASREGSYALPFCAPLSCALPSRHYCVSPSTASACLRLPTTTRVHQFYQTHRHNHSPPIFVFFNPLHYSHKNPCKFPKYQLHLYTQPSFIFMCPSKRRTTIRAKALPPPTTLYQRPYVGDGQVAVGTIPCGFGSVVPEAPAHDLAAMGWESIHSSFHLCLPIVRCCRRGKNHEQNTRTLHNPIITLCRTIRQYSYLDYFPRNTCRATNH